MKKRLLILAFILVCLSLCLFLNSCNDKEEVIVRFDTAGGSEIESIRLEKGGKITKPQDPEREGYTFKGWYLGDEEWSFAGYTVTEDITLEAKWIGIVNYILDGDGYKVTNCKESATSVVIPSTYDGKPVTSIGDNAFSGCTGLTSIEIPNSITSIGDYAFSGCTGLTSVKIPNSVTSIGDNAFSNCKSLTSIKIPNGVTSIGGWAFSWCTSLTSIEIPNSVTSIGYEAFTRCTSLASIKIPNSITSIGDRAFSWCASLTSIEIPDSVTSIGNYAFYCCASLTSIEIPNSVTNMGDLVFYECESLTIYCEAASRPSEWNEGWNSFNCPVVWGHRQAD